MVKVEWKNGMTFEAEAPSGVNFVMDAHPDHGGQGSGPTPVEALLGSIAACSAMDVISILEKKKQKVTSYRIEVDGLRPEPGQFPRPFTDITIRHIVSGENLDPIAVARSVELSDEKYCTVISTLRTGPTIKSEWSIE